MKITGDNTRMIEIAPGEWVHVRGDGWELQAKGADLGELIKAKLTATASKCLVILNRAR